MLTNFYRLISASVGTLVYYGFQCYPYLGQIFLAFSLLIGIACNIFSFMDWFNTYEYRVSGSKRFRHI
jgi:adiponectin receptor